MSTLIDLIFGSLEFIIDYYGNFLDDLFYSFKYLIKGILKGGKGILFNLFLLSIPILLVVGLFYKIKNYLWEISKESKEEFENFMQNRFALHENRDHVKINWWKERKHLKFYTISFSIITVALLFQPLVYLLAWFISLF